MRPPHNHSSQSRPSPEWPVWAVCALTMVLALVLGGCANTGGADAAGKKGAGGVESPPPAAVSAAANAPATRPAADAADVQRYVEEMRADLSTGKVRLITAVMNLTAAEAAKFWPIYQDYEEELFDLGDKRLEGIRAFVEAQRGGSMDDKAAADLGDRYFAHEEARLALVKKYHGIVSNELSPVRAAQFTQIEHRVSTVIDLLIASELPLVKGPAARPAPPPASSVGK